MEIRGIVDSISGSIIELEPKDCKDCYSLSFYDDNCAYATWVTAFDDFHLDYMKTYPLHVDCEAYRKKWCEKDDDVYCEDVGTYVCELYSSYSYSATDDELKFYSGENRSRYLLFKRNRMDESTAPLVGTKWKIEGTVDVATSELKVYGP